MSKYLIPLLQRISLNLKETTSLVHAFKRIKIFWFCLNLQLSLDPAVFQNWKKHRSFLKYLTKVPYILYGCTINLENVKILQYFGISEKASFITYQNVLTSFKFSLSHPFFFFRIRWFLILKYFLISPKIDFLI